MSCTTHYVIPRERSDRGNLQYDVTKNCAWIHMEAGDCHVAAFYAAPRNDSIVVNYN